MVEMICPHCKNPVYDEEALLCHFCGNSLRRGGGGLLSGFKYGSWRFLWIGVILLLLLAFFTLFIR